MNPVNGPVLVILLLAVVVLVLAVGAQRRVIIRTRNTLRHSQSRCRVLRRKLKAAEDEWPEYPSMWALDNQVSFGFHVPRHEWTEAAARDRHPVGKGLRVVGGGE